MAVISFKCPHCDGELIFDPAAQRYKCEYCGSDFSQKELEELQPAVAAEQKEELRQEEETAESGEAVRYTCPSCGAEIVTGETTAATFCYYCHNPVVLQGRLSGELLPDKIIPFLVPKETAVKAFLEFAGNKRFVPKAFFNKKQIESVTGVYFPYWLYDVELEGSMQGEAQQVRVWRSGDTEYTETKFFAVEREGDIALRNLCENALQKANAKLAGGVMPYDLAQMKDFHTGYLSGFLAERRDIERAAVQGKMQSVMRNSAEKLLRDTVTGYSTVSVQNSHFQPKREKWSYILFPVWTITYKGGDDKVYYYSMNGQTGRICGELPLDKRKLMLASILLGVGVWLLGLLGGFIL